MMVLEEVGTNWDSHIINMVLSNFDSSKIKENIFAWKFLDLEANFETAGKPISPWQVELHIIAYL